MSDAAYRLAYALARVPHPCDECGRRHGVQRQSIYQQRSNAKCGRPAFRILCASCSARRIEAMRVYADKREKARESKRRQRTALHARGLTSHHTPVKSPAMCHALAHLRVAPQGGSLAKKRRRA